MPDRFRLCMCLGSDYFRMLLRVLWIYDAAAAAAAIGTKEYIVTKIIRLHRTDERALKGAGERARGVEAEK